jgi:hypothetical protein
VTDEAPPAPGSLAAYALGGIAGNGWDGAQRPPRGWPVGGRREAASARHWPGYAQGSGSPQDPGYPPDPGYPQNPGYPPGQEYPQDPGHPHRPSSAPPSAPARPAHPGGGARPERPVHHQR